MKLPVTGMIWRMSRATAVCAIQARQAIDEVEGPEGLGSRRSVDALLLALRRALARRFGALES